MGVVQDRVTQITALKGSDTSAGSLSVSPTGSESIPCTSVRFSHRLSSDWLSRNERHTDLPNSNQLLEGTHWQKSPPDGLAFLKTLCGSQPH